MSGNNDASILQSLLPDEDRLALSGYDVAVDDVMEAIDHSSEFTAACELLGIDPHDAWTVIREFKDWLRDQIPKSRKEYAMSLLRSRRKEKDTETE